jgi:hypothetical protein
LSQQDDHGKSQARAKLDGIVTIMSRLKHIESCLLGDGSDDCELTDKELVEGCDEYWGEDHAPLTEEEKIEFISKYHDRDAAETTLDEEPLSVEYRGAWHYPGDKSEDDEYKILLCTGGPAVQVTGDLDSGTAHNARIEYQDWGTPWTEYFPMSSEERDALIAYAQHFCQGY